MQAFNVYEIELWLFNPPPPPRRVEFLAPQFLQLNFLRPMFFVYYVLLLKLCWMFNAGEIMPLILRQGH